MQTEQTYNEYIKEAAREIYTLHMAALTAASQLHMMNTNVAKLDKLELEGGDLQFNVDEHLNSPDINVRKAAEIFVETGKTLQHLIDYWHTTPEWARGEEL